MKLGVIIPAETCLFSSWEYNYYVSELLRGSIAASSLFDCVLSVVHMKARGGTGYKTILSSNELDGAVIIAPVLDKTQAKELRESETPVILVNSRCKGLSFVDVDNRKAATRAMEYLIQMGHRKIGFISGRSEIYNARERLDAYKSVMQSISEFKEEYLKFGDFLKDSGYARMCELLECKDVPTAVFCSNDLMALGAVKAIKESNLSVPEDVSLIGFDDLIISCYCNPPLTSVRQPFFHMGKEALVTLIDIINSSKIGVQEIEIEPRLMKRKSVRKLD